MTPEEKWDKEQPGWREELIKLCEKAREDLSKILWKFPAREKTTEEWYNIAMDMAINEKIIKAMKEEEDK